MKFNLYFTQIVFCFLFVSASTVAQTGNSKNVLFLGNSYTSANNLPQMIADAAASVGDILNYESETPGGAFLINRINFPSYYNGISKIMNGGWDHVVMQDQSLAYSNYTTIYVNAAHQLDSITKKYNPCAKSMFYITWGREDGMLFSSYYAMDSTIEANYMKAADTIGIEATPVGAIWRHLKFNYPSIDLFSSDGSHPTVAGTYAAACGFYSTLFRKDPTQITFNASLSLSDAEIIRNTAKLIVYDQLAEWNIGKYDSIANVTCLLAEINEFPQQSFLQISPNPVSTSFRIEYFTTNALDKVELEIYDAMGKLLKEVSVSVSEEINVEHFLAGVYYIKSKNQPSQILRFLKL